MNLISPMSGIAYGSKSIFGVKTGYSTSIVSDDKSFFSQIVIVPSQVDKVDSSAVGSSVASES